MNQTWLDLSRWNVVKDAAAVVASGVKGIASRLSVGNYYTDRTYEFNYDQFRTDLGLPFGAYVVNKPSQSIDSHKQRIELSIDGRYPDFWVLDAELHDNKTRAVIREHCRQMLVYLEQFQKPVVIYSRASWWNPHVGPTTWADKYYSWMAHYYFPYVTEPNVGIGLNGWQLHQGTDRGVRPGIDGKVDENRVKPEFYNLFNSDTPLPVQQEVIVSYNAQAVHVILDGS